MVGQPSEGRDVTEVVPREKVWEFSLGQSVEELRGWSWNKNIEVTILEKQRGGCGRMHHTS